MTMSTPQKWLVGCGIGCAVLILAVVGLVTGGIMYVRGRFQPLQQASDSHKNLVGAYGTATSYVPQPDGAIPRERMEAFVAVREALQEPAQQLETALATFDVDRLNRQDKSFRDVLGMLNDLGNIIVPVGRYIDQRDRILMDKHMGIGEYAYIYMLAYYSWLGHRPSEGPDLLEKVRLNGRDSLSNNSDLSPERVQRQYRRLMTRLLGNQLEALREPEKSAWRTTLQKEIDRLDHDWEAVAWRDQLPAAIEGCLRPFRDRLTPTYHSSTNLFELLSVEGSNEFRWNSSRGIRVERER